MSELGELRERGEPGPLDNIIKESFIRSSDQATIRVLDRNIDIDRSPHTIGECFVTEGFVVPAEVKRTRFTNPKMSRQVYGNFKSKETSETFLEMTPFILVAEQNGGAWLDAKITVAPADVHQIADRTVTLAKFASFEGSMDLATVSAILSKEHQYVKAPIDVFKLLRAELSRILELEDCAVTVIAIWIAMSYVHDAFDAFPYLWFNGVKGSGKTTALEFIRETAYHAEMGMRISNPALFRDVDQHKSTICYDEAENLLVGGGDKGVDQDRVSLFNSGYRASGTVRLVEKDGDNFVTRMFKSYSPKALASIQPIDEALQSRCLLISMLVAMDDSKSAETIDLEKCRELRQLLFHFRFLEGVGFWAKARDSKENKSLRKKYALKNRDWELFKPLLQGAELICPDWLPDIVKFIDGQRVVRQFDNQLSTDATVLMKLMEMIVEGEHAPEDARTYITYKELMGSLKDDFPELKWLTTRSIGNCLRRLGLVGLSTRYGKGYVIKFDRELVAKQVKRLGLEESTQIDETVKMKLESFGGVT